MSKASRSLQPIIVALLLFLAAFGWSLSQLNDRPVNADGWSSDWLDPKVWLRPLANHPSLGQTAVNLYGLNGVYFTDAQHGWAVGWDGVILTTSNGGNNWQAQTSPVKTSLYSVHFTDAQHGWAVGFDGVILTTSNGGNNWQAQTSPVKSTLLSVHFTDAQHGWAVGWNGVILTTSNGGNNWQAQTSPVKTRLSSVHFTDAQHGWAVGDYGVILTTSNGGNNWQAQTSPVKRWLFSVHFTDAQHGWAVGDDGVILTTSNGGTNWQAQTSPVKWWLFSVHFTDAQHGWAVGDDGVILTTSNGGANWQAQTSPVKTRLSSVHFTDAQHGWAVGQDGVILTTSNGGNNWQAQTIPVNTWLTSVHFTDAQHGWAVGAGGDILTTSNGGNNWQAQTSPVKTRLTSVYFTDAQHGWAVGWDGVILTTSNGGNNWEAAQTSLVMTSLDSVYFTDAQHGWAVGDDGVILTTSNGGANWQAQTNPVNTWLTSVHFTDAQHGWAVGAGGDILTTSNGGNNWQAQTSPVKTRLTSVYFTDAQHGWAVGWDGVILTTSNGGNNWEAQTSLVMTSLDSVYFTDAQHGWAVGDDGVILTTSNGGANWQAQTSPVKTWLTSVHFTDAQDGWAVSKDGVILTTSNGGTNWKSIPLAPTLFVESQPKLATLPGPAALMLLLLSTGLLSRRIYIYYAEPRSLQGGFSDAPIDNAKHDCLGRLELVKTLADLIRNRDTVPPLAIAITAPWGSGKSSMLGLLRDELKDEVFTVYLNAWHYRDDGQLLAALMEHIRDQALPPTFSLDNVVFRFRLLWLRWFSNTTVSVFVVLMLGLFVALLYGNEQNWQKLIIWLNAQHQAIPMPSWLSSYENKILLSWFSMPLASVALLGLLRSWYKDLCAFSPELVTLTTRLGKSARKAMEVSDWSKDAGLRFRFAQDFSSLANALGKGRLLLLIDDLDRCEHKQIEAVMSTLNFLFSSDAPCYSVLAMDWGYVTDALGLAFKDLAVARVDTDHKGKAFAEHYVEKIIQISIDLPAVDSSQVALRDTSKPQAVELVDWWQKLEQSKAFTRYMPANPLKRKLINKLLCLPPRWLVKFVWSPLEVMLWNCWQHLKSLNSKMLNPVYNGLLILLVSFLLGFSTVKLGLFIQDHLPQVKEDNNLPQKSDDNKDKDKATNNPNLPENKKPPESEKPLENLRPIAIVDEPLYRTDLWLEEFAGILALLLLLMIWRLNLQVQDTKVFISVMEEWKEWLSQHNDTPRDWKRLLNRARLFAMRVGVNQQTHWYDNVDKKWRALRFKSPPDNTTPVVLDERLAMHLMMLDVYSKGELFEIFKSYFDEVYIFGKGRRELPAWQIRNKPLMEAIDNKLTVLGDFFKLLEPDYLNTDAGKETRAQLQLWLKLYAGLNSSNKASSAVSTTAN